MATELARRHFTVHEYHRMVDAGILHEDDRVELIGGEILAMSPIGTRHSAAVLRATQTFSRVVGDLAIVGVQGSVRLSEFDEPQPDIYLLRPREDFYASRHAGPGDILLLVEMSDTSLAFDRQVKMRLYAGTGVPEYWIADIQHERLLVHSDLRDGRYAVSQVFERGSAIVPSQLPTLRIPVDGLLP